MQSLDDFSLVVLPDFIEDEKKKKKFLNSLKLLGEKKNHKLQSSSSGTSIVFNENFLESHRLYIYI